MTKRTTRGLWTYVKYLDTNYMMAGCTRGQEAKPKEMDIIGWLQEYDELSVVLSLSSKNKTKQVVICLSQIIEMHPVNIRWKSKVGGKNILPKKDTKGD